MERIPYTINCRADVFSRVCHGGSMGELPLAGVITAFFAVVAQQYRESGKVATG